MFEPDVFSEPPMRVVRAPMAAFASRPHGIAVAAGVVDLTEAIARATADEPAPERDPDTAAEAELVDALDCWERAKSAAEARQIRTMADLARRPMFAGCLEHGDEDPSHGIMAAASVVSAQLRISPGHARNRVGLACELVDCLPDTLAALAAGHIDSYWRPTPPAPRNGTPGSGPGGDPPPGPRTRRDGVLPDPDGCRLLGCVLDRHGRRRPARPNRPPRRPAHA